MFKSFPSLTNNFASLLASSRFFIHFLTVGTEAPDFSAIVSREGKALNDYFFKDEEFLKKFGDEKLYVKVGMDLVKYTTQKLSF